jgi:hypothetical protein
MHPCAPRAPRRTASRGPTFLALALLLCVASCSAWFDTATAAPGGLPRALTTTAPLEAYDARKPQAAVFTIEPGTGITVLALLPSRTHYRVRTVDTAGKPVVVACAADAIATLLEATPAQQQPPANPAATQPAILYTIPAGGHFCDRNAPQLADVSELFFVVRFDDSAKYQTRDPANQTAINKLFGFSDNAGHHHQFSARFGWCWHRERLELHAYVYNNGVRSTKLLGTVELGKEHSCALRVEPNAYVFTLDGTTETMPRESPQPRARGYKLFPYFGGQEVAPHAVRIWIREFWR